MTRLDAIRQRVERATKGPWKTYRCEFADKDGEHKQACEVRFGPPDDEGSIFCDCSHDECHHMVARVDAEFIAHSREDIPALLAVVEAADAVAAKARTLAALHPGDEHPILEEGLIQLAKLIEAALAQLLQEVEG